jgi:UDP-2-acetamido-3-amino-2,3-dideoxy-glucuronate N-acetyltransferase
VVLGGKMKIHALSDVQSKNIGNNTTIWQYCVVLAGAKIGSDCNICSNCFIENDVVLGDRVTIKNGVYIFDSIHIGDDVFIGPNVTFTNDLYPKSRRGTDWKETKYPKTFIEKGVSIGGGATILPGIKIGHGAIIGAGAVVTKDVKPQTVIYGISAKERRSITE